MISTPTTRGGTQNPAGCNPYTLAGAVALEVCLRMPMQLRELLDIWPRGCSFLKLIVLPNEMSISVLRSREPSS